MVVAGSRRRHFDLGIGREEISTQSEFKELAEFDAYLLLYFFAGKKFCYGSTEGQYCHCDYCKCKHGFGSTGYGHCGYHK